jgi:hypothetical protein
MPQGAEGREPEQRLAPHVEAAKQHSNQRAET